MSAEENIREAWGPSEPSLAGDAGPHLSLFGFPTDFSLCNLPRSAPKCLHLFFFSLVFYYSSPSEMSLRCCFLVHDCEGRSQMLTNVYIKISSLLLQQWLPPNYERCLFTKQRYSMRQGGRCPAQSSPWVRAHLSSSPSPPADSEVPSLVQGRKRAL